MKTTLIGIFLSFVSFSVFADDVYFHVVMDSSLTLDHAQVCAESVCQLANASGAEGYCEAFSDVKLVITKNLSTPRF